MISSISIKPVNSATLMALNPALSPESAKNQTTPLAFNLKQFTHHLPAGSLIAPVPELLPVQPFSLHLLAIPAQSYK